MIRMILALGVFTVLITVGQHAITRAAADLAAPKHCFSKGC
jgi:hypothetical protein